jgi:hypothetical protein
MAQLTVELFIRVIWIKDEAAAKAEPARLLCARVMGRSTRRW